MRRSPSRVVVVIALIAATFVGIANASAARRTALAGNLLIEDETDIFFLPHEVARYVNYVWFDFITGGDTPSIDNLGSAGILFGNAADNSFGIGVTVHRSDYQSAQDDALGLGTLFSLRRNQADFDEELEGAPEALVSQVQTLHWVDVLAGFALSDALDLGVRLSLGSNVASSEDIDGDNAGDPNPSASAFSFNLIASLGYDADAIEVDASVELSTASYGGEQIAGDETIVDSASGFGLGVFGRAFFRMSEGIDLGVIANISTRSASTELDDEGDTRTDGSLSEFRLLAGVGPRYTIGDDATVAAYVTLGLAQRTADPEGDDNVVDSVSVLLPGVHIAAEWHLLEWLDYRAGVRADYALVSGEEHSPAEDGGTATSSRSYTFYWSNGFGFNALEGDFELDATLNWPIITGGPFFLSGSAEDLFAMVTASYSF